MLTFIYKNFKKWYASENFKYSFINISTHLNAKKKIFGGREMITVAFHFNFFVYGSSQSVPVSHRILSWSNM